MRFLDQIVLWERDSFLFLNGLHSSFSDVFMFLLSGHRTSALLFLLFAFWIFYKRDFKEALLFFIFFSLMFALSDFISSGIIKPIFHRARPTYHIFTTDLTKTVFNDWGGGFGFLSGHTSNIFAISIFTSLSFKDKHYNFLIFSLAILVSFSRIYLGMHFISDVIPAILLGTLLGISFFKLYMISRRKFIKDCNTINVKDLFSPTIKIWKGIIYFYFLSLIFFSFEIIHILELIKYSK